MACKALLYSKFLWLISTFIFWCSCNFLWCIFYNLVIHVQYHTMCALTVLRCTCTYINWRMRTHNASSCRAFCIRAQEHLRLITISDYLPEPHFRVESKDTADTCWVLQLSLSKSSVRGNNFEMWSFLPNLLKRARRRSVITSRSDAMMEEFVRSADSG